MLTLKAHAKVNLGLSILGRRPDGFHEIDTLLARLALHDTLTLEPLERGVRLEVIGADLGIPSEENLAYRAAELYLRGAGEGRGVSLRLEKRIPAAAGLGGGSSDAGAVLRGLAELYPAGLDLVELAAQLGSDVPFFAADLSVAQATGRGEVLASVDFPELHLVLVHPGVGVSAGDAYRNVKRMTPPLGLEALLDSLLSDKPRYFNALEPGVVELEPTVGAVLSALRATALRGVMMSGSGSTCFGLAETREEAESVAHDLADAHPEWWVCATQTS